MNTFREAETIIADLIKEVTDFYDEEGLLPLTVRELTGKYTAKILTWSSNCYLDQLQKNHTGSQPVKEKE